MIRKVISLIPIVLVAACGGGTPEAESPDTEATATEEAPAEPAAEPAPAEEAAPAEGEGGEAAPAEGEAAPPAAEGGGGEG